jgi:tRNA A37 threonylcarbamoyladenosine dehydratase
MSDAWMSRTKLLVKEEGLEKLKSAHVMVIGMGGVGSFAAEFIARAGVGEMTIIDGDVVDPSNRNRQLPALATTHGVPKTTVMAERLLAINPELKLNVKQEFIQPEVIASIFEKKYAYVIEAIDSITPKLTVISECIKNNQPIVSSMGAGAKLDPTQIRIVDISKTYNCPFAQYIRKRLKEFGIKKGLKVAFSAELPIKESLMLTDGSNFKKSAYGTISYLPAAFGGACASVAIRDIIRS